uniref:Ribosomal protein L5 n=1 Tax=Silene conica TaxID=39875 RepID=G8E8W6_SILCO|nr:ribosomal protein L5 [Silene conica]
MLSLIFHYNDVLRQDLLLKLNHVNAFEVPILCEIRIVPKEVPSDFLIKNGKLAMEITCGQKLGGRSKGATAQVKSFRSNPFLGARKGEKATQYNGKINDIARQSTIRGRRMSSFLVRALAVLSLLSSPVEIRGNSIKFSMEPEFCSFFPELEDHFEIFEHIIGFNVTILTSAKTEAETALLWSGLLQKDEGK